MSVSDVSQTRTASATDTNVPRQNNTSLPPARLLQWSMLGPGLILLLLCFIAPIVYLFVLSLHAGGSMGRVAPTRSPQS